MRLPTAALLTLAGVLTIGTMTPVTPAGAALAAALTWTADLGSGEGAGVDVTAAGSARLDRAHAFIAPLDDAAPDAPGVPTGLLTLPAHDLAVATDRVDTTVVGDVPAGSTASVDVRGLGAGGDWTEWVPSTGGTTTLPGTASQVQARLVLTASDGPSSTGPSVTGVTFTAHPATPAVENIAARSTAPLSYRVFATREGLVGSTTANGHVITTNDHFVALPSRRALSPRGRNDYSVKVCAPSGKCAFAPVWDVGPWNTRDDYWNPGSQRQQWGNLPQGLPEAQAAYTQKFNGGKDQFNRRVANPAGIDLADGLFRGSLGLRDNSYVTVNYLWTGSSRTSRIAGTSPVNLLAAPNPRAAVVGVAAQGSSVPVECSVSVAGGRWVRVGPGQYLAAAAVPDAGTVGTCPDVPGTGATATAPGKPPVTKPPTVTPPTTKPTTGKPPTVTPPTVTPPTVTPPTTRPTATTPPTAPAPAGTAPRNVVVPWWTWPALP